MDNKHSSNGWDRIGGIRSESNPTKFYILALRTTGYLGCDCPSWKFKKGVKAHEEFEHTCKHIRAFVDGTVRMADMDLTVFGTTWLHKRLEAKIKAAGG